MDASEEIGLDVNAEKITRSCLATRMQDKRQISNTAF
jgi:hypothetical protein